MSLASLLTDFITYLNQWTVACAIIFAVIALFLTPPNNKPLDLEFVVGRALSGSALPTGIALLGCAFKPELLPQLDDASLNIAVAGITLLFISIKSIFTD